MRCNESRLKVLLNDSEDSAEFRSASNHVESCSRCQQRLLVLSGSQTLLQEVRETLQACGETEPYHFASPSSVVISIEGNSDDDIGAECEPVSLAFLSPPSHPEMLGRIGRYEIERMIGSGGMGIVFKGFDSELHRVVAIKVLKPHLAHNGAARRRFAREAQSAAAVVHEHVIPIHDVLTDGDTPYLVMQFVPGQSLQARVDERGPLDAKEVLRIARQAAAGLAAAHSQGVVHRDVKPANILLEESVDRVLISDFGLARTVDDATLTRTGVVAGTPHYMSPEQASGQPVDQRSDLFSLGSSIYFMCTGRPPFRAEHALAILNRICNDKHRPVDEVNSDVPAELADLVDRLLSKNPADRFRDAHEVERQLESILIQLQNGHRSSRIRWRRIWLRWRNVIRKSAMAAGVIGICVLIGFGLAFWNMPAVPTPRTEPLLRADSIQLEGESPRQQKSPLSIITLPPDTFEQDLAATQNLLNDISVNWNTSPLSSEQSGSESNRWSEQVSEILERINE
ncbi:MAG: serine/threonine-protein kinase [Planctomycetaceae bacterium]